MNSGENSQVGEPTRAAERAHECLFHSLPQKMEIQRYQPLKKRLAEQIKLLDHYYRVLASDEHLVPRASHAEFVRPAAFGSTSTGGGSSTGLGLRDIGATSDADEQAPTTSYNPVLDDYYYHTILNRVSNGRAMVQNNTGAGGAPTGHLPSTNWGDLRAGGSGSTISCPSSPFNEIMSAGASSGFTAGGGDALGAELNDYILAALRSAAGGRGHGGSQTVFADRTGGRFLAIRIDPPRQGNQDGPDGRAQCALQAAFGGLVPPSLTLLLGDNIIKGGSPGYIKAAICAGLLLVLGFTCLGLASKKRAMAAARVVASASMAAVLIALVYCLCSLM